MARGVDFRLTVSAFAVILLLLVSGCGEPSGPVLIGSYPLDNRDGLLAEQESVDIDTEVSTDGGGSVHIYAENQMLVNLYELPTEDIAGNALVARCQMKSVTLAGGTTFELWVFPEEGPVRSILKQCQNVGRTKDWQEVEVIFPLRDSETSLKKLRLSLNLGGRGHLWVDDLQVFSIRTPTQD
jgi:hypothetical protein